jgi:hypothetical protein
MQALQKSVSQALQPTKSGLITPKQIMQAKKTGNGWLTAWSGNSLSASVLAYTILLL